MSTRLKIASWLLCASSGALGACSPAEIHLEEEPDAAALEERKPGDCAVIELMGGPGAIKITLDALPRTATSPRSTTTTSGGKSEANDAVGSSASTCPGGPGEYALSLSMNGREALSESFSVPAARQFAVVLYAHTEREPRLRVAEVDLSPAGPGLRRARVTNYIEVIEPIQLFYYDANDEPVGESEPIAWGETWTGTIPSGAIGYRLTPTQPLTQPFDNLARPSWSDAPVPADLPCIDALPLGLVITGTYAEFEAMVGDAWQEFRGTSHVEERYTYLPPLCFTE
jgi:hypothetical protein